MNFVTGASGLVGSYLCRYLLEKGEQVTALKRKNSKLDLVHDIKDLITWVEGDMLDAILLNEVCEKVDYVYHAAAVVSYEQNKKDDMYVVNVTGTRNIVDAANAKGIKKLLFVSSIAALGKKEVSKNTIDELVSAETWNSNYGQSKNLAELEVWRAQAEGLSTVIINPSVIIGGGYWNKNSGRLFKQINDGFPYYSNGATGFVDVRDVVRIMHRLMHSNIENERYIVSAGNKSYKGFFALTATALNVKAPYKNPNKTLQNLALWADWCRTKITGKQRFLTREIINTANVKSVYENEKIKSALNYSFKPLRESIEENCKAFKEALQLKKQYSILDFNF